MKTRRLSTILTSAYLSAMLATSVAPVRSDAAFAATIDPSAAQKALRNAAVSMDFAGWMPPSAPSEPVPPVAAVRVNNPPPKTDPVMTEELMGRLVKAVRSQEDTGGVDARICKVLDLCDGTELMPLKLGKSDSTDGIHYLGAPPSPDAKDILILVKHGETIEAYLTDMTRKLRAAAILEKGVARLITNEKANAKFQKELSLFAGEAASLPPTTGTAVAGNS